MDNVKRKISIKSIILIAVYLTVICAGGCSGQQQRPLEKEEPTKQEPTISLYVAETGEKKEIKMEDYIKGVVAAEMEPTWPVEALAAQAILARTFTLERIEATGGVPARGTDASTNIEEFQAYNEKRVNDNVRKAVESTRGQVVKYKNKYVKTWFFADGGGVTAASAEEGLAYTKEPTPYIQSVKDPGFAITTEENKSWTAKFPLDVVQGSIQKVTGKAPGTINTVQILKKGPSGRAMTIKLGETSISGPALRLALGKEKMRSTLLTGISIEGGHLIVSGKGFGHGVGMSQWGAKALASEGKTAQEIIKYFFKDVEITKEWK